MSEDAHEKFHGNCDPEDQDAEKIKGYGHGHSHSAHGNSNSVTAVAWMVIMGDGLHNFCDGLAIGKSCQKFIFSVCLQHISLF